MFTLYHNVCNLDRRNKMNFFSLEQKFPLQKCGIHVYYSSEKKG